MGKKDRSVLFTEEKKTIFRPRVLAFLVLGLGIYALALYLPRVVPVMGRICGRFTGQDLSGLYEVQVNLIVAAIATLSIITTFLDKRYLGANYKYWMFKETPFVCTPQEIIALMLANQFFGLPHLLTGGFETAAVLSVMICWVLFAELMFQVYVYVIKVSRVFRRVRKQLVSRAGYAVRKKRCRSIIRKVRYIPYCDARNSYYFEEVEIILQIMAIYRYEDPAPDSCRDDIEMLKNAVIRLTRNEACVRCERFKDLLRQEEQGTDSLPMDARLDETMWNMVKYVLRSGNAIVAGKAAAYERDPKMNTEENLKAALRQWFD